MEGKISVSGNTALLREFEGGPVSHKVDHSQSITMIGAELDRLASNELPKLICIEGVPGSGKTILAKVLASTGSNTQLIDVVASRENYNKVDASEYIKSSSVTYILDEAGFCTQESLASSLSHHLEAGGTAVLLCQFSRDLDLPVNGSWFSLSHNVLTKHRGAGSE